MISVCMLQQPNRFIFAPLLPSDRIFGINLMYLIIWGLDFYYCCGALLIVAAHLLIICLLCKSNYNVALSLL